MNHVKFVDASNIRTLEDYAAALLCGAISLSSLELFHIVALKKGFLSEEEQELAKTIHWELTRLKNLYRSQLEHVLDRTELTQEAIFKSLECLTPKTRNKRAAAPKKGQETHA